MLPPVKDEIAESFILFYIRLKWLWQNCEGIKLKPILTEKAKSMRISYGHGLKLIAFAKRVGMIE